MTLKKNDKEKIDYINKRIDFLYKRIGVNTIFITAFFFNTLKYFLPYLEKLFIISANNLSIFFQKILPFEKDIYGLGDFLATFMLFPFFTLTYTLITMFWLYFIIKDYNQIKKLNNELKIYDNFFKIKVLTPENSDVIEQFSNKSLKIYENIFENEFYRKVFSIIIIISYILYVIYKY